MKKVILIALMGLCSVSFGDVWTEICVIKKMQECKKIKHYKASECEDIALKTCEKLKKEKDNFIIKMK